MDNTKKKKSSKILYFVGGAALTAAGFIVIPPLIKKYSNKAYKASVVSEDVDIDSMGPEIVRKETETEEEE